MQQTEQHLLVESPNHIERLEVLEGPTGRRSWADEVKARIVLESFQPAYIEYTKTQRKQIIGKTAFLRKFYKLGGTVSRPRQDGKRVHIVSCPPLDRMRKRFKELYGKEIVD